MGINLPHDPGIDADFVHLTAGLRAVAPEVEVVQVPVVDGGDGTLDAAVSAGYRRVRVAVVGTDRGAG
jgi:glycerate kinase